MVRHKKQCTSPVRSSDLAKVKFKPGKFVIVKTVNMQTLKKTSTSGRAARSSLATPENDMEIQPIDTGTAKQKTDTGIKSALIINAPEKNKTQALGALKINIPTTNKFQILEDVEEVEEQSATPTTPKDKSTNPKIAKPPPIVIHHKIKSTLTLSKIFK